MNKKLSYSFYKFIYKKKNILSLYQKKESILHNKEN